MIDSVSGEVLPDGQTGELVITSLTREACPVIRYRTRDLAWRVKSRIGISCQIRVLEPESIERSIGKAKRIVDLRA